MKKIISVIFVSACFLFLGVPKTQAGIILPTDGFDAGWINMGEAGCFDGTSPYGHEPSGWTGWQLQINRCTQIETTTVSSPPISLKIVNKDDGSNPMGIAIGGIYRQFMATGGVTYTLTGKSYRYSNRSADFVGFRFDGGTIYWRALYLSHGTGSWASFSENITAPAGAGNITIFLAGGINSAGAGADDVYFDDIGLSATDADNASCWAVSVPATIYAGHNFTASVYMQNTGSTTWTAASQYQLASQTPFNNTVWGANRATLMNGADPGVTPGGIGFFAFSVTAPASPGSYSFNWQMIKDSTLFGGICTKTLTVSQGASLGTQTITPNTADGGVALSGGSLRTSGLRSNQGGSNHYNSLTITQNVTNPDAAALTAIAFTNINQPPAGTLQSLANSANSGKGFVLLYANQDTPNTSGFPSPATFSLGKHYAFFGGTWRDISDIGWSPLTNEIFIEKGPASRSSAPQFNVRFLAPLGTKTWGTYGYLKQTGGAETIAVKN